jgi:hypothetical protein
LRIPAGEIEHLVTTRVRKWLLDPGGSKVRTKHPEEREELVHLEGSNATP